MSPPLVSIVIPIFNQERFVVETVGSALEQTYSNVQVVVVDDGSTDDSTDLLARTFGERIVLIRQKNQGPSAALNAGIRASHGEFIALMGGDDVCIKDRLQIQMELIESAGSDVIFSKPILIDDDGIDLEDDAFPVFFRKAPEKNWLGVLLLEGNFICAPTALIRRRVVEQIGVFHPGLIQLQDFEYWMRALAAGFKLSEHEPRVVKYRRHANNLSSHKSNFASAAEMIPVMKMVLEQGNPARLRAAVPHFFAPVDNPDRPLSLLDRALLLLAHERDEVRMAGVEYATKLFATGEHAEFANKFDFSLFNCVRNATQQ